MIDKPFRVEMRLKNNRLARIRGSRSAAEMDRDCGLNHGVWGRFENLKELPVKVHAEVQKGCWVCGGRIPPRAVVCSKHKDQREEAESNLPSVWRTQAVKLAEAVNHSPDYLWPECVQAVRRAEAVFVEVSEQEATALHGAQLAQLEALGDELALILTDGSFTKRERRTLIHRFGLNGEPAKTLQEIAEEQDVGRERIRQIEAKALRKLRHPSRAKRLKRFVDIGD